LHDELVAREREVGLGVLSAVGEHPELSEVGFLWVRLNDPG
jgi:hypothetical protein